jgi:hypothetical protein
MGMRTLILLSPALIVCALLSLAWLANRFPPSTSRRLGALVVLLSASGAGLFFQGSFLQTILLMVGSIYLLLPFSLVLIVMVLVTLCKRRPLGGGLKQAAFIWIVLAGSLALSWGTGNGIRMSRESATREEVARMIAALDQIKSNTGAYPTELPAALTQKSSWAFPIGYSSDGKVFRFGYDDTAGMMDGYEFNSEERVWHHYSA